MLLLILFFIVQMPVYASEVTIDNDLITVVGHPSSVVIRDERDRRIIHVGTKPLQTKKGTIVVGKQAALLSNLETSTASMSLNDIEVVPGATIPVNITLNEHGQIRESLTITDSQFDQRVDYQMTVAKLRSDYEHPVQPQCTSPYTVVEGDDSWSVKDDVCRYDVLANIHCTPESPNYNASTEMCSGTHTHSPKYSCQAGYTLSGGTCRKSVDDCRFGINYYEVKLPNAGNNRCHSTPIILWAGVEVQLGETYYQGAWAKNYAYRNCTERGPMERYMSYQICKKSIQTVPATPYCDAGYTLNGARCLKTVLVNPTYSCSNNQTLIGKVCREELTASAVCTDSHPYLDLGNEVCRSYEVILPN